MDFTKFCTTSRKKKDQPQSSNAQITSAVSETITKPDSADSSVVSNIPPMQNFDQFVEERKIPIANQIDLTGHSKAVSCISIEPAGNRVVTGSYDYAVKIYDFGGMDSRHRPFQSIEAQESHMVVSVSHSPSGDRFIAATGSAQPKVFDRDGKELIKFVRGDMYLRDLSNTKGHTMEVTGVMWHPTEKEIVLTCSMDGSLRVWDLQGETTFGNLINRHVLKVRGLVSANRVGVTSCCYSPSGQKIIGGCADGSVHIWLEKRVYSKADIVLRYDLFATKDITSVTIHKDNNTLAMRCTSGHVALWDIRSEKTAKTPVKILPNLPNDYPTANVTFSPDGTLLCCGTSPVTAPMTVSAPVVDVSSASGGNSSSSAAKSTTDTGTVAVAGEKGELKSRLYFYDVASTATSPSLSIALEAGSTAIMVRWHPSTNQILCTMSSGVTRVLYDPLHSKKGALLSASKAPKRIRDGTDFAGVGEIYNPLALPMYRTDMPGDTKKRKAELKDPYLAKIPAKPVPTGPGNRANNNFFFTNYVMKDRVVDQSRTIDPREALLSVDAETKADPKIFGKAYGTTQPNAQLHSMTFEAEQEEFKKNQKKL